jgi:hypothetical protein
MQLMIMCSLLTLLLPLCCCCCIACRQYAQAPFKTTLDAFSQKAKGTGASAPKAGATGRKLAL